MTLDTDVLIVGAGRLQSLIDKVFGRAGFCAGK